MRDKEVRQFLKEQFNTLDTPGRKEVLLEELQYIVPDKTNDIKVYQYRKLVLCMLCLVLFIPVYSFYTKNSYEYIVSIDINPSIEIKVNKNDRVAEVLCHNEEANKVITDMNLKGTDIDIALNAIIGSMYTKGYITELKNSVLVSVHSKTKANEQIIKNRVVDDVENTLSNFLIDSYIISLNLEKNTENKELAKKCNTSLAKIEFINEIIDINPDFEKEELIQLSVTELDTLMKYNKKQYTKATSAGTESNHGYLNEQQALDKAYDHSNIIIKDIINQKIDMIAEDGRLLYEIYIENQYTLYEYKINAVSGEIVDLKKQ